MSQLDWNREGLIWPHRDASAFITAGGARWHVQRMGAGQRDKGSLLLLHGTGASVHSWRDLMPLLAQSHEVIAIDLPRHAFTTGHNAYAMSLPAMGREVAGLLKHLNVTPAAVIGHSAGAAIALQLGLDHGYAGPIIGLNAALRPFPGALAQIFPAVAKTLFANPLVPRIFTGSIDLVGGAEKFLWRSTHSRIDAKGLWDYSLHQLAADQARFGKMDKVGNTAMTGLAYAYHFDASRYALYLRDYAEARGVTRTEGIVESVARDGTSGDITAITLAGGRAVAGDFFIDCTGFRSLLLGGELRVGYDDWSRWLPCDRALAVPSERLPTLVPYTRATAKSAGWQWRIPLQHRTGNGHVYSSGFTSDEAAADTLMAGLDTKALGDPRPIRFTTGRRQTFWAHNCAAIGLSSGFLEPLESTSIHLIQSHVSRLIQLFPRSPHAEAERAEYNRRCAAEFEQIRDFLILHYHRTDREDTEFWRYCKHMAVPDSLTHKLALFAASGRTGRDSDDLFRDASWVQVMLGQGIMPADYDPMADQLAPAQLTEFLANLRTLITRAVGSLPTHEDYLRQHCAADPASLAA